MTPSETGLLELAAGLTEALELAYEVLSAALLAGALHSDNSGPFYGQSFYIGPGVLGTIYDAKTAALRAHAQGSKP